MTRGSAEEPGARPEIDRLVHEPARYAILAQLSVIDAADFIFLMRQTGLTWGNLSSHLSKLEAAGYVAIVKEFLEKKPHTLVSLTDVGRDAFEVYRRVMAQLIGELPGGEGQSTS